MQRPPPVSVSIVRPTKKRRLRFRAVNAGCCLKYQGTAQGTLNHCSFLAGRWGTLREIADAVVFIASDRAAYINGAKLNVDGGYAVNVRG